MIIKVIVITKKPPYKTEKIIAIIPFVQGLCETVSRIIAPLGIQTAMKPQQKKWILIETAKDPMPPEKHPSIVYVVGCTDCKKIFCGGRIGWRSNELEKPRLYYKGQKCQQSQHVCQRQATE